MHPPAFGPSHLETATPTPGVSAASRHLLQGHDDLYEVIVRYVDGTHHVSNLSRCLPERDAHMRRVCDWLVRTGRDHRIDSIELIAFARLGMRYVYIYDPRRPAHYAFGVRGER